MAMVVNTNVASLEAQRNVYQNQKALQSSFNKLSSGFRVNSAADDAAGLAISESLRSQVRSYTVAERNAADGVSMVQAAEGALGEMHNVLGRMREIAMQASNGSLTETDRGYLGTEYTSLKNEVSRIQSSAKFNGKELVGSSTSAVSFQVGLGAASADTIAVDFGDVKLTALLATGNSVTGTGTTNAVAALSTIDTAIGKISTSRSKFGAAMNRLDIATSSIQTMRLNLAAADSRIRDVDVAEETSRMSRNQVLTQAGASVLAQANQLPQMASGLIGR